jgi:hypothetical protein
MYQNQYSPLNYYYVIAIIFVLIASLKAGYHGICTKTKLSTIKRIFLLLVGISALYLIFAPRVKTFLPFLGKTVFPPSLILLSEQANTNATVKVKANGAEKVAYWAAHPDHGYVEEDPYKAYSTYKNFGVAAVKDGYAILKLRCPTEYKVYNGMVKLPKHVHYRLIYSNGVVSEVKTIKLEKQCEQNKDNVLGY